MSFENWSVSKKDFFSGTKQKTAKEFAAEYSKVAKWCNESGLYTIYDDGDFYKVVTIETLNKIQESKITPEQKALNKRLERDALLSETDRYMLSDFPISDEKKQDYVNYRKYLRDIPESPDFPDVEILTFEEWKE